MEETNTARPSARTEATRFKRHEPRLGLEGSLLPSILWLSSEAVLIPPKRKAGAGFSLSSWQEPNRDIASIIPPFQLPSTSSSTFPSTSPIHSAANNPNHHH